MLVDGTFLLQIANFWCAYLIFTRIFVRPAYAIIRKQEAALSQLIEQVEQEELETREHMVLVRGELTEMQQNLVKELPERIYDNESVTWQAAHACAHKVTIGETNELAHMLADQVINDVSR